MERNVSSPKILNIIICVILLIAFAVVTKVNVQAKGNYDNETASVVSR